MLGIDPLYVANEGKFLAVVPPEEADAASRRCAHPLGADAADIGEIVAEPHGIVVLRTAFGGTRIVDMLVGDPLPRSAERRSTMCLGIPGQVVEIADAEQSLAKVDVNGVQRNISVRLLADDDLQVGDWVLVHVGFAMAKIDEREAALTLDQVQKMGADYVDEIDAFNARKSPDGKG